MLTVKDYEIDTSACIFEEVKFRQLESVVDQVINHQTLMYFLLAPV